MSRAERRREKRKKKKQEKKQILHVPITKLDKEHLDELLEAYGIPSVEAFMHQAVSYWFRPQEKGAIVSQVTILGAIEEWVQNAGKNMHLIRPYPDIENDLWDLRPEPKDIAQSVGEAIIIGAGPSIFEDNCRDIRLLYDYLGTGVDDDILIIACDRVLKSCLEHNVVPDFVTAVDSSENVADWLQDPLVKEWKPQVPLLANVSLHPRVAREWVEDGGHVYWFIGALDEQIVSNIAHTMHLMSNKTVVHTGGNVGATSWFLAACMKRSPVALIGFDYSYDVNSKIYETQKFPNFVAAHNGTIEYDDDGKFKSVSFPEPDCIENIFKQYRKIYNPYYKKWCMIDYLWDCMRASFVGTLRNMLDNNSMIRTINCTPGGALFDDKTNLIQIQEWEDYLKNGSLPKPDWMPSPHDLPEEPVSDE